jgi:MFS family permease
MRLSWTRTTFLPPAAAFVLQRALLAAVAWANHDDPFRATTWARWDSTFYLQIASSGYLPVESCRPETHYPATAWCGNAGWFPGYAWLAGAVAQPFGASPATAAVWISALAQLACLVVLWILLNDARQWPALAVAAFFPGNVYMAAIFPVSVTVLGLLGCIGLCWSQKFKRAALAAAAASACYPTGVLLAPVAALWALLHRRWRAGWVVLGALGGVVAVLLVMRSQTGVWDAFARVQAKYSFSGNPLDTLGARLKPLVNPRYRDEKGFVTGLQTLLCGVLVVWLAVRELRQRWTERSSLVVLCVGAFWIAPLALGGRLSLYRSEALLLPVVLLLPGLPRSAQIVFLAAAIGLSVPMASMFFRGVLV